MTDDRKRQSGELIAKHNFGGVEATRSMLSGSTDPGQIRQRMEARAERATYPESDADDPASLVQAIIDRVTAQHQAMERSGAIFDAEMDGAELQTDNWN